MFKKIDHLNYQTSENVQVKGDYQPFIELVVEVIEQSFEPYFLH